MNRTFAQKLIDRSGNTWTWLAPFGLAAAFQIAAYLLTYGLRVHAMQMLLPPAATDHDRLVAAQTIWQSETIRTLFLPIRLVIGWGFFALCLSWGTGFLVPPRPVRFRELFSLELFAELIPSLGVLLVALIAPAQSTSGLPSGAGVSLLAFVQSDTWFLKMLLANANLFQLLYIIVLTVGIHKLSGLSPLKSAIVPIAVWILSVATQISFLQLSMTAIHFTPN